MITKTVEWSGSAFALLGSFLLATNGSWADFGFIAYFVSNIFLIAFSLQKRLYGILVMQIGFTVFSVLGMLNTAVLNTAFFEL